MGPDRGVCHHLGKRGCLHSRRCTDEVFLEVFEYEAHATVSTGKGQSLVRSRMFSFPFSICFVLVGVWRELKWAQGNSAFPFQMMQGLGLHIPIINQQAFID